MDATDTAHRVFTVREAVPLQAGQAPGDVVLLYPEWETASHAPTATAAELAGLVVRVDGRRVAWRRDPVDVHAFRVPLPAGARTLALEFQFLAPATPALLRPDLVVVPWHRLLLYPAGWYVRDVPVAARLALPAGLRAFSALDVRRAVRAAAGDTTWYAPAPLEALADAPVYAGRYWREIDLAPETAAAPVRLDVVADTPGDTAVSPDEVARLRALVAQTLAVFGPAPYRHYDAIVSLSDALSPGGGIEHLEEGETNLPSHYFDDVAHQLNNRDLIAHEFVHAWNGRARQPADLWSPTFNLPVRGSLLWVYEGQTELWGRVLAARAGLRTRQETLDKLALDAALVANRPGRAWKSLADATNDAVYMAGRPVAWRDWQRREDYYPEGVLLWLDVEARLRELSGGARGLDDVTGRLFATRGPAGGAKRRPAATTTYTFRDVCAALGAVAPDDWAGFLRGHLDTHDDAEATAGLARAGWRVVYDRTPSETFRQDEAMSGVDNLDYSVGFQVRANGGVRSVVWGGPAFAAGLAPGARVVAVEGQPFSFAALDAAVRTAAGPLTITVEAAGRTRVVAIPYRGPLRYPRLERIAGTPDRLSPLLAAR